MLVLIHEALLTAGLFVRDVLFAFRYSTLFAALYADKEPNLVAGGCKTTLVPKLQ